MSVPGSGCIVGNIGSFNGVNEYVKLSDAVDGQNRPLPIFGGTGGSFALSTWVSISSYRLNSRIIDLSSSTTSEAIRFGIDGQTSQWSLTIIFSDTTPTISYVTPIEYETKRFHWYHIMIIFDSASAQTTGTFTLFINGEVKYMNTIKTFDSVARPNSYLGRPYDTPNLTNTFFRGQMANFAFWTRNLTTVERTILIQNPPASVASQRITTVTPPSGTFGAVQSVQLDSTYMLPVADLAVGGGYCVENITRVEYGPEGLGSICTSLTVLTNTRLQCLVAADAPLNTPIFFTVFVGMIAGPISVATYTAIGSPSQLRNSTAVDWELDFRLPSSNAAWLPGPSKALDTGVADFNGINHYIDLNLAADVQPPGPFPSTFSGTLIGFTLNVWAKFDATCCTWER